ncbi:MAG: bifunctional oligoribonuclease/PAP phosphatase NrnA [Chitinophagales bacterium]|nr:bifunctional oligoribonuclease/PAP phosphatase NrnA [Chitinophagales bacterium]
MAFSQTLVQELANQLTGTKQVVIVTHPQPDGDALGSSLGWKKFLEKKGHQVSFISPTDYTKNLSWIPGTDTTMVYDTDMGKKLCNAKLDAADLIFCLDFNSFSRIEELGEAVKKATGYKVMIDHHQQPDSFADLMFSDTSYCATAEMVYDIVAGLSETDLMDEEIALCLYVGLATDNGFFQFNNATPNAFRVAAALVQKGVKPDFVSEKINNVFRETRLRFFGYCLHEKLKLVKGGKVAYMMLTKEEIKKFNLQSGDSEGLVNYPFKIDGVMVSAYFSEEPDKIKVSFRSRGSVDVNTFARTYFEGGGHRNAAGGKSLIGVEKTEKKFLKAINDLKI